MILEDAVYDLEIRTFIILKNIDWKEKEQKTIGHNKVSSANAITYMYMYMKEYASDQSGYSVRNLVQWLKSWTVTDVP